MLDLLVIRRPPSVRHFFSQRTRQAYNEWARPIRFSAQLALLPLAIWLSRTEGLRAFLVLVIFSVGAAEVGRRKGSGSRVLPSTSALWAPAWLGERAITAWIALFTRLLLGGVRYRDTRLKQAATPFTELRRRIVRADPRSGVPTDVRRTELQRFSHEPRIDN